MRRRQREMAEVEAMETGKPVFDTYGFDTRVSIWAFEYFADLCREIKAQKPEEDPEFEAVKHKIESGEE